MTRSKRFITMLALGAILLAIAPTAVSAVEGKAGPVAAEPSLIQLKYAAFDPMDGEPHIAAELTSAAIGPIHLVQVSGPLTSPQILELEAAGAELLGYVPDFTYIARIEAEGLQIVRTLPTVRWIGPYHPAYKIKPGLLDELSDAGPDGMEVNINLFPSLVNASSEDRLTGILNTDRSEIITENPTFHSYRARIDRQTAIDILALPEVRWIHRYTPPETNMNFVLIATRAGTAHTAGFDGTGIVGEVKDNGIQQNHPDFGNLIGTYGGPVVDSHGTCTFGIVFGDGTNSANALGMMPGAGGVFCDWYVSRSGSISNLKNSWGGVFQSNSWSQDWPDGEYTGYSQENDQAIVDHDVLMFYSAGNYGTGPSTCSQDSSAKNVLAVGAVYHQDTPNYNDDQWENHGGGSTPAQGPAADGRIKPDICGFFDHIYTTDRTGSSGYSNGDYDSDFGGTSAACPIVAGASGLIYQMFIENHFGNNAAGTTPHAATVKALLIANARQYEFSQATRYRQGWGLADVGRVHQAGTQQFIVDGGHPLSTGESWSTTVMRSGSEPMKISLVWSDKPGETSSSKALINDLDLTVIAPDSTEYHGNNGLVSNLWSTAGGSADRLNNIENVFIEAPMSGSYTIQISGFNVAMDNDPASGVNQDFSLVATMVENSSASWAGIATGPGPDPSNPPLVRVFNAASPSTVFSEWSAYGVDTYGSNVACGDLTGDGMAEVLTGPGPGTVFGPHVRAFSASGSAMSSVSFLAYGTNKYGVNVSAGDIDGDGFDEILTGAGPGQVFGPHVRAWNYDNSSVSSIPGISYFAYGTNKYGVNVSAGDIDGDGFDEILTGAGPGAVFGPHVRGWNVDGSGSSTAIPAVSFLAYGTNKYGVNVACGDIDGDGYDEIITGAGPGAVFASHVRGWNFDGSAISSLSGVNLFAYQGSQYGVQVTAADLDGDGMDEIITAPGPDAMWPVQIRAWNVDGGDAQQMNQIDFSAYDDLGLMHGGRVAAGTFAP